MVNSTILVVTLAKIKSIAHYFAFQSTNWTLKMALLAILFFRCKNDLNSIKNRQIISEQLFQK